MTEKELFPESTNYKVTARKWRPQNFFDVTSQEFITTTLKNAVVSNRISHAYLFTGPRGVGKTTVARILAKSLNCTHRTEEGEPCNKCDSCREISNDNRSHPDVFEIDGASNRNIEDIRELKEKVKYGPIRSKYKIFIIDEVHMLTGASFNALLKTLEEPPSYIVFIFATTAPEKVPLTILGRCQKFDFKRITVEEIINCLEKIAEEEKIKIDSDSLFFIAKKGDGSMRDAQGLFDMSSAYCDNDISFEKLKSFYNLIESDVYFKFCDFIFEKDSNGILKYLNELINQGFDLQSFLDGLIEHFRNMLVTASTKSADFIIESENVKNKYLEYIGKFSETALVNSLKLILQTEYTFKYSSNQRTLIEALLIELIKYSDTKNISDVLEELKKLQNPGLQGNKNITDSSAGTFQSKAEVTYSIPKTDSNPVSVRDTEKSEDDSIQTQTSVVKSDGNKIENHWDFIKDQIRTERKWVYSIIKDAAFQPDGSDTYLIRVDDNKYDVATTYKDYLTKKIATYFGGTLSIRFVRFSEYQPIAGIREIKDDKSEKPDNHERICSFLKSEFNAREVTKYPNQ